MDGRKVVRDGRRATLELSRLYCCAACAAFSVA
jgi:hypothetical protein